MSNKNIINNFLYYTESIGLTNKITKKVITETLLKKEYMELLKTDYNFALTAILDIYFDILIENQSYKEMIINDILDKFFIYKTKENTKKFLESIKKIYLKIILHYFNKLKIFKKIKKKDEKIHNNYYNSDSSNLSYLYYHYVNLREKKKQKTNYITNNNSIRSPLDSKNLNKIKISKLSLNNKDVYLGETNKKIKNPTTRNNKNKKINNNLKEVISIHTDRYCKEKRTNQLYPISISFLGSSECYSSPNVYLCKNLKKNFYKNSSYKINESIRKKIKLSKNCQNPIKLINLFNNNSKNNKSLKKNIKQ